MANTTIEEPGDGTVKLPNIPIKIVRQGDKLKFTAGKYSLTLNEMEGLSQTYPLLLLDKFITEVTTVLLSQQVERKKAESKVRDMFLGAAEEVSEGKLVDHLLLERNEDIKKGGK